MFGFPHSRKNFLPSTTSAISGAANSNLTASTRFAAWTTNWRKNGNSVLQQLVQKHRILLHAVDENLYTMKFLLVLKQSSCSVSFAGNEASRYFSNIKKSRVMPTDRKGTFSQWSLQSMWIQWNESRTFDGIKSME